MNFQVSLLKEGKDIPPELALKLDRSASAGEQLTSPSDSSNASIGSEEAALREKVIDCFITDGYSCMFYL
jgi:hypothetical protein